MSAGSGGKFHLLWSATQAFQITQQGAEIEADIWG